MSRLYEAYNATRMTMNADAIATINRDLVVPAFVVAWLSLSLPMLSAFSTEDEPKSLLLLVLGSPAFEPEEVDPSGELSLRWAVLLRTASWKLPFEVLERPVELDDEAPLETVVLGKLES